LGANSKQLQQIAVDGRKDGRLDKDAILSLLQQEKDMSKEHVGFIKKIVFLPLMCYIGTTTVCSIITICPSLKSFLGCYWQINKNRKQ